MCAQDSSTVGVLSLAAGPLQVALHWAGDRFQQSVSWNGQTLLQSLEGDESQTWPPSPPLQQLLPHSEINRQAILGIGSAGTTHWSLAIEAEREAVPHKPHSLNPALNPQLTWHYAARVKRPAASLGSTFILHRRWQAEPIAAGWVLFPAGRSPNETNVTLETDLTLCQATFLPEVHQIRIDSNKSGGTGPNTVQWRFWMKITSNSCQNGC